MVGMDFFIRPATGTTSADWVRIPNADIKVRLTRRMTRTIVRGEEGDNLHDEGSESAIYTISGEMQVVWSGTGTESEVDASGKSAKKKCIIS